MQRCRGAEVQRCKGAVVQWCEVLSFRAEVRGAEGQSCICRGAELFWCRDAEVLLKCRGVLVEMQRCCSAQQVHRCTLVG